MEFLGSTPVANTGPKRRGRWAQPGVELSVRSMLDLRQLETLAPSPRGPSQDSLAVSPSGPGMRDPQAPALSCTVQVSFFQPEPSLASAASSQSWSTLGSTLGFGEQILANSASSQHSLLASAALIGAPFFVFPEGKGPSASGFPALLLPPHYSAVVTRRRRLCPRSGAFTH